MKGEKRWLVGSGVETDFANCGDLMIRVDGELLRGVYRKWGNEEEKIMDSDAPRVSIVYELLRDGEEVKDVVRGEREFVELGRRDYTLLEREIRDFNKVNPLSDEWVDKFYEKAYEIARAISKTYWQVDHVYSVDDVVQEVVIRVASRRIKYDPEKSGFPTFVYMLIQSTYRNLSKSKAVVNMGKSQSLEEEMIEGKELSSIMPDKKANEFEQLAEIKEIIEGIEDEKIKKVIKLKLAGYKNKEIGKLSGKFLEMGREILDEECGYSWQGIGES